MSLPETILTPDGYTVADAGPDLLRQLLAEFEVELTKQHVPVDLLRPGRDFDEVKTAFSAVDRNIPDEVAVWFAWHDGEVHDLDRARWSVLPKFQFWSTELVLDTVARPSLPYGDGESNWNPEWVHLLGDNNGLIVSCATPPRDPAIIRALDPIATLPGHTEMQSVSLCTPVAWWIEGLRNEWYKWDLELGKWSGPCTAGYPLYRRFTGLV